MKLEVSFSARSLQLQIKQLSLSTCLAVGIFATLGTLGCASRESVEAAPGIVSFLQAISIGDENGVASGMDRSTLHAQVLLVANKLVAERLEASSSRISQILIGFAPILVNRAVDRALEPKSIIELAEKSQVKERLGRAGVVTVALGLKLQDDGHLCLPDGPSRGCVFRFARVGEEWKLAGLEEKWLEERLRNALTEMRRYPLRQREGVSLP